MTDPVKEVKDSLEAKLKEAVESITKQFLKLSVR